MRSARLTAGLLCAALTAACAGGPPPQAGLRGEAAEAPGTGLPAPAPAPAVAATPAPGAPDTAAGTQLAGLIGSRIDDALDTEDRREAYEAQMRALDTGTAGAPIGWRNHDSGRFGTVVPGPPYRQGDSMCRQYSHTIYIDAKPQTARGTACHTREGGWTRIS